MHINILYILLLYGTLLTGSSAEVFVGTLNESTDIVYPGDVASGSVYSAIWIQVQVQYNTSICYECRGDVTECCPHMFVHRWDLLTRETFNNLSCADKITNFTTRADALNSRNVALVPENVIPKCISAAHITMCNFSLAYAQALPKRYSISFGSCYAKKIVLNYKIRMTSPPYRCERMIPEISGCKEFGYTQIALPGIFGFFNQKHAYNIHSMGRAFLEKYLCPCYQHAELFACRAVLPECKERIRYFPCKQMCLDLKAGCRDVLRKKQIFVPCDLFVDSTDPNVCFYQPVQCPYPKLENGAVAINTTGVLANAIHRCHFGLTLNGPEIRHCQYNGTWDGVETYCTWWLFPVWAGQVLLLLGIIVLSLFYNSYHRQQEVLKYGSMQNRPNIKYDAFVSYNASDAEFVEDEFRLWLEDDHNPSFRLCLHRRDFLGGPPIVENIMAALEKSATCIAMVSRSYLQSSWCQHEFQVAHSRMVTENLSVYSLILVFLEDIPTSEIPPWMKSYTYTSTYIMAYHGSFLGRLIESIQLAREASCISPETCLWPQYSDKNIPSPPTNI